MKITEQYQTQMLNSIKEKRNKLIENAKVLNELLPNLPEPAYQGYTVFEDPWLTYPYDRNLIFEIKKLFRDAGWKIAWEVEEAEIENPGDNPRISFRPSSENFISMSVICEFSDAKEGSTCTRKKIGRKRKSINVYEWNCEEVQNG